MIRTDRHTALMLAGEHELRRLATRYPGTLHPRTLREAFPQDHWRGAIEHHRRPLAERVAAWIKAGAVLATFAGLGVLLAWRG